MSSAPLQVISGDAQPLSEEAALAEAKILRAAQLNATVLAARWGWHRSRVQRRLRRWSKQGLIEKPLKAKPGAKKGTARAARKASSGAILDNVVRLGSERDMQTGGLLADHLAAPPAEIPKSAEAAAPDANDNKQPDNDVRDRTPFRRIVLAIVLATTAITLGAVASCSTWASRIRSGGRRKPGSCWRQSALCSMC